MKDLIKTKDIRLGAIRKFIGKGLEYKNDSEFVLLVKDKDKYLDLFSEEDTENFAVFKRLPYSNTTLDGVSYGTKVFQVNNFKAVDGSSCVLLENVNFKEILEKDVISADELKNYALQSKYFIRQRKEYAISKLKQFQRPLEMLKVIINDTREEKRLDKEKVMQKKM